MHQTVEPPELDLYRETVETQARTIKYLLANYEALLRKVGYDRSLAPALEIDWRVGAVQVFAAGAVIPRGWWVPAAQAVLTVANLQGSGTTSVIYEPLRALFSDGTPTANAAVSLAPLTDGLVWKEETPAPTT